MRLRQITAAGVSDSAVRRLVKAGKAERVGRGIYGLSGREPDDLDALARVSLRVPQGVICLMSAARVHEITTANTPQVWVAVPHGSRRPSSPDVALQFRMWRNPVLFEVGVQEIDVAGVPVRITDPARTVVDLFRPQNRVSDERAIEALGLYLDQCGDPDVVLEYAERLGIAEHLSHYLRAAQCLPRM